MDVAPGPQNNAPQASSSTSKNVGDDPRVWLWYMSVGGIANPPKSLLHIPHDRMRLYSLKPRKWLLYLASVTLGIDGTLRFLNGDEELTEEEMDEDVSAGDRYVFCFDGEARFLDYLLRTNRHDQSSSTSTRSRLVSIELKEYYGGCPFSRVLPGICEVCHLIPFTKGDDYLHRLLASRGEPDDTMTINDYQNQIVMSRNLHAGFDLEKCIAFLKTPNKFLKTNEVPGGENALPDTYRVTVHCFLESEEQCVSLNHNAYSSMTKGCGSSNPPASRTTVAEYLPKDILLDVTYASIVINNFGTPEAKEMLEKNAHDYYPDGIVKRGEDREGTTEKERKKRKYKGENQGRSERVVRRSRSGNNDSNHADRNGKQFDFLDGFLAMQLMIHGIQPGDIEAEEERRRRETEELNAKSIARWRKAVNESSL